MLLSRSSFLCLTLALAGFLRAFQLYLSSTKDLRTSNEKDLWYYKGMQNHAPTKGIDPNLINHAISMRDTTDKLFYFVQVKKKKEGSFMINKEIDLTYCVGV